MHRDRPCRPVGAIGGPAVTCLFAFAALIPPSPAVADTGVAYANLSADAKVVVQATNEAFGGEIGEVCKNDVKAIHKKVFEITNEFRKAGTFQGQGYYGLEARTYYSRRCRDFE